MDTKQLAQVDGRSEQHDNYSISHVLALLEDVAVEKNLYRLQRLIPALVDACETARMSMDTVEWRTIAAGLRSHSAFGRLLNDPFTRRAFEKPRGYPGDAVLLDYMYKCVLDGPVFEGITPEGKAILSSTSELTASRAVRNRRALLARNVDAIAKDNDRLSIASLACGHLREAQLMTTLEQGRILHYWAIDQDQESVAKVEGIFQETCIHATIGSVRDFLAGRHLQNITELDVFYAAGLFDYLGERIAMRLTATMFDRLRPGGVLWIANFVPDHADRAYMEAFMDWRLIYRTPEQLDRLDAEITPSEIDKKDVFFEAEQNIAFFALKKKG